MEFTLEVNVFGITHRYFLESELLIHRKLNCLSFSGVSQLYFKIIYFITYSQFRGGIE